MPKICDPPSFNGGQSAGIAYRVLLDVRLANNPPRRIFYSVDGTGAGQGVVIAADNPPPVNLWQGRPINGPIVSPTFTIVGTVYRIFIGSVWVAQRSALAQFSVIISVAIAGIVRVDGLPDTGGNPPPTNCRCSSDSCRVNCAGAPDGFCCVDHTFTNQLLQVLQN